MSPKILFLDIETFPMRGYFWELFEANILWVDQPTALCCFSVKWLGGKQITLALPDYPGYHPNSRNDRKLVKEIWKYLDETEIVIGQNHISFDLKVLNTLFVKYKMKPPSPYKTFDTLRTARKIFKFPSNRLDELGDQLHEGRKLENEGKHLWRKCIQGNQAAWKKMKRYNAQDVRLLERVYNRFLPWLVKTPNAGAWNGMYCKHCGGKDVVRKGKGANARGSYQRFYCKQCKKWISDHK